MKARLSFAFVLIMFFGLMMNLFAQNYRGYIVDKLDLTNKQISEVEKLRDEHLKKMSDLKNELDKLAIDLRAEWRKTTIDRKRIEALQDKINELRGNMQKQRLNHWFDVYNLLDEKQKEKFRELRVEIFKDWKGLERKLKRGHLFYKKGFRWGLCPCGMGPGPWWDK